jgi:carbon starvation protein CstA
MEGIYDSVFEYRRLGPIFGAYLELHSVDGLLWIVLGCIFLGPFMISSQDLFLSGIMVKSSELVGKYLGKFRVIS